MKKRSVVVPLGHPLVHQRAGAVARRVKVAVDKWLATQAAHEILPALEPFTTTRPLCYFDRSVVDVCLHLFETNPAATLQALERHEGAVTHAILALLRKGSVWGREEALSIQSPQQIAELERVWHPEYQRVIEHIWNNLITPVLDLLGMARKRDYVKLTLANRITSLRDLGYPAFVAGANATIRNAISHGGVRFGHARITYQSSNQTLELLPSQFTGYLDRLTDTSSAIVTSLLLFMGRNPGVTAPRRCGRLPLGLRFLLVRGATHYSGFVLDSVSESEIGVERVLNLYGISKTRSRMVHRFDGVSAASQALKYGGDIYGQIAVSIDCGGPVHTYSPYKVREMKAAFQPGAPSSLLASILDVKRELLWYNASTLSRKLYVWKCSMLGAWLNAKDDLIERWRASGLDVLWTRYVLRFSSSHGNKSVGRIRRIEGHAVLVSTDDATKEMVWKMIRHASRRLRRKLLRSHDMTGKATFLARHPKYVWLTVHSADGRLRELDARAPGHASILATAEWIHRSQRGKPIVVKQPSETEGGYRVRFFI